MKPGPHVLQGDLGRKRLPWAVVAYDGPREVGRWHYATKASAERAATSTATGGFLVVVRNLDEPVDYIRAANGMRVPASPINSGGRALQDGPHNWLCRACGLGFVHLKAAKAHARRAHALTTNAVAPPDREPDDQEVGEPYPPTP